MDIELHGFHTRDEYFRAMALLFRPEKRSNVLRFGVLIVLFGLWVYFLFAQALPGGESEDWSRFARLSFSVGLLAYFVALPYIQAYRTAIRLWNDLATRGPQNGRISSDGVAFGTSETIPWDQFARLRRAPHLTALLTAGGLAAIFPRNFFATDADWTRFNALADERVKEAK